MKVKYHTKKIDRTLYNQIIYKFVAENINDCSDKLRIWKINIYPVEMFDDIYPSGREHLETLGGVMNMSIPHGVTGKDTVDVFVYDTKDYGLTVLQNASVITHELAHMILMIRFLDNPSLYNRRGILRNDDKGGNKAGQELNKWTQEVHDREIEGNLKNLTVYRRMGIRWYPYTVRVLNLEGFHYNHIVKL